MENNQMGINSAAAPAANILVVDDVPANLQLLTDLLRAKGFKVRPVPNGELALQTSRLAPPDLVLLDVNMPGLSGYEVCERFKADAALKAIPIIFVSALDGVIDKVKAFAVGGVDYVAKPFEFEEVEARLRTHLELARLRRELEQHNANLAAMVAARTRELAEANARLAILDQAKSDFLNLISHEIRTPLNGVFGATELILMIHDQDPETAGYAKLYDISRRRLMTLLDDAMLLTQIGVGTATDALAACPLAEVLPTAWSQASPLAQDRGVVLAPAPAPLGRVRGDPQFLVRALQSLLETAAKFARAGTTVRLTQTATPGAIQLVIETEGPVVPAALLPRFFDLLTKATPISGVEDMGLAPALAERIVTLYGGAVSVANAEPSGIRLTVRLKTVAADLTPSQEPLTP
jgi:two-component system sensor histidine kinase/response regulator